MKGTFASLLLALVLAAVSHPASAGLFSVSASSDAIKGKVVDAATGKPLAGVLVVATWHAFTPVENKRYGCLELVNVLTAVSGADGSYEFPAWSGKSGKCGHMLPHQPYIGLSEPGYFAIWPMEIPSEAEYDFGPDHTVSEWDGHTFRMQPLGPHYSDHDEDSHLADLRLYAWAMVRTLGGFATVPCFWKEERPLLLMLLQEQRRLSAYASPDFDVMDPDQSIPMVSQRCTDPEDLAALRRQASGVMPEEPILPYLRNLGIHSPKYTPPPQSGMVVPPDTAVVASQVPERLADYEIEDLVTFHEGDQDTITYHVDVNPANPYYLAVLSVGEEFGAGGPGDPDVTVPDFEKLAKDGVYGLTCPVMSKNLHVENMVAMQYEHGILFRPAPSQIQGGTAVNPTAKRLGLPCSWVVALVGTDPLKFFFVTAVGGKRDVYDSSAARWTLTEHSLVRPKDSARPEILEIHGPASLKVTTTLDPAGRNRWHLPPLGQSFTVTVTATAPTAAH